MEVIKVIWWEHKTKLGQYSSAKVHRSLEIKPKVDHPKSFEDYEIIVHELNGLRAEVIDGI